MALRERLDLWREPASFESSLEVSWVPRAALDVARRLGTPVAEIPSQDVLAQVRRDLVAAFNSGTLSEVPKRLLKYVPWALFYSHGEEQPPLWEAADVFEATLEMLRQRGTARTGLALAQCYLRYYEPRSDRLDRMRLLARQLLEGSRYPKAVRFLELSGKLGLLEPEGHPRLADAILQSELSSEALLADAGLVGELAYYGYIEHAFAGVCEHLQRLLPRGELTSVQIRHCLDLAVIHDDSGMGLRFGPETSAHFIDSLLAPFQSVEPDGATQQTIKEFVLHWYGDPRLKPQKWSAVSTAAVAVMRKWLVAATLEHFFQILDENANRYEDADRQWPYRRAFWTAYLEADHVVEAWVALSHRVAADSRLQLKEVAASYGELKGGRPDHAVLILQVADLIVTEWSHMGKYRVWHVDSPSAPKLYKSFYHRRELLYMADFEGSHHGAENGRWQRHLSDYIRRQTGIKFGLRELMP